MSAMQDDSSYFSQVNNIQKANFKNNQSPKKVSNEYLYQFNENDFEARISPYLGYQLSKKDKIESISKNEK